LAAKASVAGGLWRLSSTFSRLAAAHRQRKHGGGVMA